MRYVILEGGSPPTLRFVTIGGEGVEKSQFQRYVIYGWPLSVLVRLLSAFGLLDM